MQVLTENGFKDFIGVRKVKSHMIFRVEFDDGTHLDATKDHRLKMDNGKFVTVAKCRDG